MMAERDKDEDDDRLPLDHWHLQKGIPISLIVAIFLQTIAVTWWGSNITTRVALLETQVAQMAGFSDRVTRLEEHLKAIDKGVEDIKNLITAAIKK